MDVKTSPLELCNMTVRYGSFTAVDDISFKMSPGEIFGLLGPNGAGKTSLISCIVTLRQPTSGHCAIFGINPEDQPIPAKLLTGYVPQEIINHGYFTVEEIMGFHSGYFQVWNNKEKIKYLLERLGLYEHRNKKVKALSGGMKRRLLIAKALVHDPKLLLLDEPTAGVDIELRASLWDFVRELREGGMSILLTTHYLEEAEELCDRVGVIQQGQLRKVGPTQELIKQLTDRHVTLEFTENYVPSIGSPFLQRQEGLVAEFVIPQELGIGGLLNELNLDLTQLCDIRIAEGNLEEAFVRILGEKGAQI